MNKNNDKNVLDGSEMTEEHFLCYIDTHVLVSKIPDHSKGEITSTPVGGFDLNQVVLHARYGSDKTLIRLSSGDSLILPASYITFVEVMAEIEGVMQEGNISTSHDRVEPATDEEVSYFLKKEGKLN